MHDVGIATQVFRMAGFTLCAIDIGESAVKTLVRFHVGGNLLVTGETKRRLFIAIAAIVTIGTGFFEFGMGFRDFARH